MKKLVKSIITIIILLVLIFTVYWLGLRKFFAKQCVKSTLMAMQTCDFTDDFYYINLYSKQVSFIDATNIQYVIMNNCNYELLDLNFKCDNCNIKATYPDIEACLKDIDYELTEEELTEFVYKWINSKEVVYKTEELELQLESEKFKWYIIENSDLINVYTGGIYNVLVNE